MRCPTIERSTLRTTGTTIRGATGAASAPRRTRERSGAGRTVGGSAPITRRLRVRNVEVFGTDDSVDEPDGETETVVVLEDFGEAGCGASNTMLVGHGQPLADELDSTIVERAGIEVETAHEAGTDPRTRVARSAMPEQ